MLVPRLVVAAREIVAVVQLFVVLLDRGQRAGMRIQHPILLQLVEKGYGPRLRVRLGIIECEKNLECIGRDALPAFRLVQ